MVHMENQSNGGNYLVAEEIELWQSSFCFVEVQEFIVEVSPGNLLSVQGRSNVPLMANTCTVEL